MIHGKNIFATCNTTDFLLKILYTSIRKRRWIPIKRTLMIKNKEIMLTEYDSAMGVFTKIYEVYNIDYAPCILKCSF